MQQSAAFKILRTRLKTVPSYSFSGDQQVKRSSSGNTYQILHHLSGGGLQDGDVNEDERNLHNGIKFTLRLQQFEKMQNHHRLHAKAKAQSRSNTTSSGLSQVLFPLLQFLAYRNIYGLGLSLHRTCSIED